MNPIIVSVRIILMVAVVFTCMHGTSFGNDNQVKAPEKHELPSLLHSIRFEQTILFCGQKVPVEDPEVRVIINSGFPEKEMLQRFRDTGFAGFLQKPIPMNELLAKVRQVIRETRTR